MTARVTNGRSFPDPNDPPVYVAKDDFEWALLEGWAKHAFAGQPRQAMAVRHLWRAYVCGVDQDEILERLQTGEAA